MNIKKIYWGTFFIAMATLTWEVLLTRIFSATMYYHFVFMSISLAMLGFGCSGILIFLLPEKFSFEKCNRQLAIFPSLFSITTIVAILVYLQINSTFTTSVTTFLILLVIFCLVFIPYFFSGLTITLAFKHYARHINVIYFYDLLGAGIGSILIIGLLFLYDGISLVLFVAFIGAVSSVIFSLASSSVNLKRICMLICCIPLVLFVINTQFYRFLKIKYVQGVSQENIIFEEWNPINRVTVTPTDYFGHKALNIQYDSTALAKIHAFDGDASKVAILNNSIHSFYYQIAENAKVLIIGVGGGQDVLNAYINGHTITGIEINPTIARLNTETYRDFNGNLFGRPEVQLLVNEGRNFIRHNKERYDIIHLPNVDSGVASSSGAFTFVENTLYTVEAFEDYYNHLTDNGVLWISRWRTREKNYFLENFRVLTGVVEALHNLGINNPEKHIVMIEEPFRTHWRQAVFLLKKTPFTKKEINTIDKLRIKMKLEWLHHPYKKIDNQLVDYLYTENKDLFIDRYPVRIDANTDNCPFFFNFLKPKHYIGRLPTQDTHNKYPVFIFKTLFVIVFFMVLTTILLPLLLYRPCIRQEQKPAFRWGYILYFTCLGLGFMLVEIPYIQKFILFLGQPLYAIAIILTAMLISSGLGSLCSGLIPEVSVRKWLCLILALICICLSTYLFFIPYLFEVFLGTPLSVRVIISALAISGLGFMMGMAFPLGIRMLNIDAPSMLPWVWGINGACSVLGSIVAWGLSLNFGYIFTLEFAITVYAFALAIILMKSYVITDNALQKNSG